MMPKLCIYIWLCEKEETSPGPRVLDNMYLGVAGAAECGVERRTESLCVRVESKEGSFCYEFSN